MRKTGILLVALIGCSGGSPPPPVPDPAEWGQIEAGARARALGIARYELSISTTPSPQLCVDVLSAEGALFGTVTISASAHTAVANYVGHDGETAVLRTSGRVSDTRVFRILTQLGARGSSL